jgi:secreted PhoX family phosphatase
MTVTPQGGLLLAEDDASSEYEDSDPLAPGITNVNRLIGITAAGEAFKFAVNVLSASEMAGVTFSPDGETLFVNIFGRARFDEDPLEGMTCAITGPWADGPL